MTRCWATPEPEDRKAKQARVTKAVVGGLKTIGTTDSKCRVLRFMVVNLETVEDLGVQVVEACGHGYLHVVRAFLGRLSALSVFPSESVLYGAFVCARGAVSGPKRRFPARAICAICAICATAMGYVLVASLRVACCSLPCA
jgi:hypothetical protein